MKYKITKADIEHLADDIIKYLIKNHCEDTILYYNDKQVKVDYGSEKGLVTATHTCPLDYFEYAAKKHILSMSFEGWFYHIIDEGLDSSFQKILDKYGLYYELGNSWNLTCYPDTIDIEDVEYTDYSDRIKPVKERTYIMLFRPETIPDNKIKDIMEDWYQKSNATGDLGGCVIGAGIEFDYCEKFYKMIPCSPYQGENSWTPHVDHVINRLKGIGCTNIVWQAGRLD